MRCKFCKAQILNGVSVCPACGHDLHYARCENDPGRTNGIISLVLGILSLILQIVCGCCTYGISALFGLIMAIVGVILGKNALKISKEAGFSDNTFAKAGFILNIVSVIIAVISAVIAVVLLILSFLGIISSSMYNI